MPIQKDLKRLVRSRMSKTGESYTAARLHIVNKAKLSFRAPQSARNLGGGRAAHPDSSPSPRLGMTETDYAALSGMSDAVVKKQTGRGWAEWVRMLDAARASEKPHRQIAEYVSSLGTPDWWSQMVTVGYERIRGLREIGQRRGGTYEVSKSRTFSVPVTKLYDAFTKPRLRNRWLAAKVNVRTRNPNKTMRIDMEDGTLVQFYFTAKSPAKSSVAVQHQKLPDKASVEKMKTWWTERLDALAEILE